MNRSTSIFIAGCLLAITTAAQAFDRSAVEAVLQSPARKITDKVKDAHRKPLQVLEFLGIEPGMTVLDVYAAGGYYTLILSKAVGEEGSVLAQNSSRALSFQEDRSDTTAGEALAHNIEAHQLRNVQRLDQPLGDIDLLPNSLDAVLLSKIFHDYHNRNPRRADLLLSKLKAALKPGGLIGLIDHHGDPKQNNLRLHRVPREDVLATIERAGLVVEAESDLLRNPRDSRGRAVFDPTLNGNTDRFLLRIRKPLDGD